MKGNFLIEKKWSFDNVITIFDNLDRSKMVLTKIIFYISKEKEKNWHYKATLDVNRWLPRSQMQIKGIGIHERIRGPTLESELSNKKSPKLA